MRCLHFETEKISLRFLRLKPPLFLETASLSALMFETIFFFFIEFWKSFEQFSNKNHFLIWLICLFCSLRLILQVEGKPHRWKTMNPENSTTNQHPSQWTLESQQIENYVKLSILNALSLLHLGTNQSKMKHSNEISTQTCAILVDLLLDLNLFFNICLV